MHPCASQRLSRERAINLCSKEKECVVSLNMDLKFDLLLKSPWSRGETRVFTLQLQSGLHGMQVRVGVTVTFHVV